MQTVMTTIQEASLVLGVIVSILMLLMTRRSPLFWAASLLLVLEALLQQTFKSFWRACEDYAQNFQSTHREVRHSIAGEPDFVLVKKEKRA